MKKKIPLRKDNTMENRIYTVSKENGFSTIAEAQAAARQNGGTVLVKTGIYRESIVLDSRDS